MPQSNSTATPAASQIWWAAVAAAVILQLPTATWAQQSQRKPALKAKAAARVCTFVEQMPELPSGGGMPAVVAYFLHHFHLTKAETRAATGGRVAVEFVVTATGSVTQARILRSGGASVDAAALRTVRSFPRFHPGHQSGIAVAVKLVIPISCIKFQ